MAIPPEPLERVLPKASWIVEAEVKEVLSEPEPKASGDGAAGLLGPQVVRLSIKRVLRGQKDTRELVVKKPEGAYRLRAGNKGPFLLDAGKEPTILGRYGPDSYALSKIEAALQK